MAVGKKPPQMVMLETKGIRAQSFFRFTDSEGGYYAVSRNWQFSGLDGEVQDLSEDIIWERFDAVEKIDRKTFEEAQQAYRDTLWHARGQPDSNELDALAQVFLREYKLYYSDGRWHDFCMYDEETLRRLIDRSVDEFFDKPPKGRARQKKWQEIYRDLVMAKVLLATRAAGSG